MGSGGAPNNVRFRSKSGHLGSAHFLPKATSNATSAKGQKRTSGPYSKNTYQRERPARCSSLSARLSNKKWITQQIHTPGS